MTTLDTRPLDTPTSSSIKPRSFASLLGSTNTFAKYNFLSFLDKAATLIHNETLAMAIAGLDTNAGFVLDFQRPITEIELTILAHAMPLMPDDPNIPETAAAQLISQRTLPRAFGTMKFDTFERSLLSALPSTYLLHATMREMLSILIPAPETSFFIHNPTSLSLPAELLKEFPEFPASKCRHIILAEGDTNLDFVMPAGTTTIIRNAHLDDIEACVDAVAAAVLSTT